MSNIAIKKFSSATELEAKRQEILKSRNSGQAVIAICCGTGCQAYGAKKLQMPLKKNWLKPVWEIRLR